MSQWLSSMVLDLRDGKCRRFLLFHDPDRISSQGDAAWYCVQTLASKEPLAVHHLQRQNFEVFLPRLVRGRRHARRYDTVLTPLFPGYLFVRMDPLRQRWRAINSTFGVARLLLAGEKPLRVPAGVVEVLLDACDAGGVLRTGSRDLLNLNDEVRILVGPFAERMARVARLDPGGRVELLLELLGGSVAVNLPRSAVLKSA